MLVSFVYLWVISAYKPYCTDSLSNLQTCSLFAEFVTLFSGILLIIDDFLEAQNTEAGVSNADFDYQTKIVAALIFGANYLVIGWPVVQAYVWYRISNSSKLEKSSSNLCGDMCKGLSSNKLKKGAFSIPSLVFSSQGTGMDVKKSSIENDNDMPMNQPAACVPANLVGASHAEPSMVFIESQVPIESRSSTIEAPIRLEADHSTLFLDDVYREVKLLFEIQFVITCSVINLTNCNLQGPGYGYPYFPPEFQPYDAYEIMQTRQRS